MNLPAVPASFYWTDEPWGPALRCRPLEAIAPHVFTTRQLELRRGGPHSPGWRALATAIGAGDTALVRMRQVHGREVVVVRHGEPRPSFDAPPDADIVVSDDEDCAIAVQAADCVPLLIADATTGVVAAVHAGWRGTAAGAASVAVGALAQRFGSRPEDLVAAIGPSIGTCCYEVGDDLREAFVAAGHDRTAVDTWLSAEPGGKARLDLWAANRDQLIAAGVRSENVHVAGLCTATHVDLLYSFRAEGEQTGRLAAAIRRRGTTGV